MANPVHLKAGLDRLCRYAVDAVEDGFEVLILPDRAIDSDHAPIPSLLATAAVHHHLIRKGCVGRWASSLKPVMFGKCIILPVLIGFGATAINPYLALSSIRDMKLSGRLQTDLDDEQSEEKLYQSS